MTNDTTPEIKDDNPDRLAGRVEAHRDEDGVEATVDLDEEDEEKEPAGVASINDDGTTADQYLLLWGAEANDGHAAIAGIDKEIAKKKLSKVERAEKNGQVLLRYKKRCGRKWIVCAEKNLSFSVDTAERYMNLAKYLGVMEDLREKVVDMGLVEAGKFLAKEFQTRFEQQRISFRDALDKAEHDYAELGHTFWTAQQIAGDKDFYAEIERRGWDLEEVLLLMDTALNYTQPKGERPLPLMTPPKKWRPVDVDPHGKSEEKKGEEEKKAKGKKKSK
jgi:hypothetical protein